MRQSDFDDVIARAGRIGKNVALPKVTDPTAARAVDMLQRQIGELSALVQSLSGQVSQGPLYSRDSAQRFYIDARGGAGVGTFNILTAPQAVSEGLPNAPGFVSIKHGLLTRLDLYQVVSWSLNNPSAAQPADMGWLRMYAADLNRTVFQISSSAQTQEVFAIVELYSSQPRPTAEATTPKLDPTNRLLRAQDMTVVTFFS